MGQFVGGSRQLGFDGVEHFQQISSRRDCWQVEVGRRRIRFGPIGQRACFMTCRSTGFSVLNQEW